jgi:hypothetical protein
MPKVWRSLLGNAEVERSDPQVSMDDWVQMFGFGGLNYALSGTSVSRDTEAIENSFIGYINGLYKTNGIVFACMEARRSLFTEARFQWQRMNRGRPGDLFGTRELDLLETPWPNGTTGELLSRAIQDVDLSGNHYLAREAGRLRRLRPDWVEIVLTAPPDQAVESDVVGYIYWPGGIHNNPGAARIYSVDEMAHWSPIPDPEAQYRGMSWLTPVIREVMSDKEATVHKGKFYANAATPKLAVSLKDTITRQQFLDFMAAFSAANDGVDNAYKCLHPDTDVAMWDGTRRPAGLVVPGDRVVSWSDGRAVPGTVSEAQWQAPSPIVTVTTQRGRVIRTNDRHPFLARRVIRQGARHLSEERWIDAEDLKPGDLLTTGLGWASDDVTDTVTAHQAWVLGALVGDGSLTQTTPVISAWDSGVRDRFEIGYTLNHTGQTGHNYRVLGVRALCVDSGIMGKRSWEKRIPESVMTGSTKVKSAFLSGLIDTDGHVTDPSIRGSAEVGITSTSHDLLLDAQHVLASLGVNASVSLSMPSGRGGKGVKGRDAWRLHAMGNIQAARLNEVLDLACSEKSRRLSVYATAPSKYDRSRVDRVVSVEVSTSEPTIGLEIAEHHTHVTGGVVTHNTMYLGGGADVSVIGADMQQLDFKVVQGAGETRIAAAARVHPVIVGLSEGMQGSALNAGNYKVVKESFGDQTLRPLWRSVSAAYQSVLRLPPAPGGAPPTPGTVRLWYDDRDVAFLRTDRKEAADIMQAQSETMSKLITAGFEPDSVVQAVVTGDLSLLKHSGLVSVQLLPPGQAELGPDGQPVPPDPSLSPVKALPPGQPPSPNGNVPNKPLTPKGG